MTSNLEILREFIAECPLIDELTDNIHIDWTQGDAENYGIMPTGVNRDTINQYIDGSRHMRIQEDFSLYCDNYTFDDVQRLEQSNFMYRLMEYMLETPIPFTELNAELSVQNGSLFEIREDGEFGKYLIQINLTYEKYYD